MSKATSDFAISCVQRPTPWRCRREPPERARFLRRSHRFRVRRGDERGAAPCSRRAAQDRASPPPSVRRRTTMSTSAGAGIRASTGLAAGEGFFGKELQVNRPSIPCACADPGPPMVRLPRSSPCASPSAVSQVGEHQPPPWPPQREDGDGDAPPLVRHACSSPITLARKPRFETIPPGRVEHDLGLVERTGTGLRRDSLPRIARSRHRIVDVRDGIDLQRIGIGLDGQRGTSPQRRMQA